MLLAKVVDEAMSGLSRGVRIALGRVLFAQVIDRHEVGVDTGVGEVVGDGCPALTRMRVVEMEFVSSLGQHAALKANLVVGLRLPGAGGVLDLHGAVRSIGTERGDVGMQIRGTLAATECGPQPELPA
jgi:hypothetical protein